MQAKGPRQPRTLWADALTADVLYVVIGNFHLMEGETTYPTQPGFYGLDPFQGEHYPWSLARAYILESEAVEAIYRCGLEPYGAMLKVFRWTGASWAYDEGETSRVIDETPW